MDRDTRTAGGPVRGARGCGVCGLPGARDAGEDGGVALSYGLMVACISAILLLVVGIASAGVPVP